MSRWQQLSVNDFFLKSNWEGKKNAGLVNAPKPISVSQLVEKVEANKTDPLTFSNAIATPASSGDGWECLSVENLFKASNWEGKASKKTLTAIPTVTSAPQSANSVPPPPPMAGAKASGLSILLSVENFFDGISWEGMPAIGILPELEDPNKSENTQKGNITLDDFSQLF